MCWMGYGVMMLVVNSWVGSASVAGDQLFDCLGDLRLMVTFKIIPGHEAAGIFNSIQKKHSQEVINFMPVSYTHLTLPTKRIV